MNDNTKNKKNHSKRALIITVLAICATIICLLICSAIIDYIEEKRNATKNINFNFYPVDFEENIFDDETYLELIEGEFMRYCDSTTNLTVGINREDAIDYGKEVKFLVEMIHSAIYGDSDSYNACFSDDYYKTHQPKETFTMQKIYDVTITYISQETITDDQGDNYTKSTYSLEYKIHKNNGTFRNDIGNGSKKQYLTLSDRSETLLIDNISTVNTKR